MRTSTQLMSRWNHDPFRPCLIVDTSLHPIASRRIKTRTEKNREDTREEKTIKKRVEEKQKTWPAHRLSKSSEENPHQYVTPGSDGEMLSNDRREKPFTDDKLASSFKDISSHDQRTEISAMPRSSPPLVA